MKKIAAEKYRDIDFSRARRGAVVKPEPGKTKISIRLDNIVLNHFRSLVDKAGGELAPYGLGRRSRIPVRRTRSARR